MPPNPPKPRIAKPGLVWRRARQTGEWIPYHRTYWTEGGKERRREIRLDWKGDPQELDRLYWEARAGLHERQVKPVAYSWRECVIAWRSDTLAQGKLKPATKAQYRREMDAICEANGGKDMRRTTRQGVRSSLAKLAETPRKAARRAQIISLLWNYARKELDWPLGENPAEGLGRYKPAREYLPWPRWMVDQLGTAPRSVQIAAELIIGTGQRPTAAITMRRSQFRGDEMTVRDEKGERDLVVYCPKRLRAFVEDLAVTGQHLLAKNLSEPVGYNAVEKAFRAWRKGLGPEAEPYSLHGLRKLAIIELAEADATDAQIQAVTGQSAEMVAYYRAKADRFALSRAAQQRRE